LLKLIPPHNTYVEVFGGGATLLFAKTPSLIEVYNDIDNRVVNFFRVLQNPEKCLEMYKRLALTLYSRKQYYEALEKLEEGDDVDRAVNFFIAIRQAFSAKLFHGWSMGKRNRNQAPAFFTAVDFIPVFHARIKNVLIENDDFRKIIPRYDTPDTFFYCDPPYLNLRNPNWSYPGMSEKDHEELVELLLSVRGKVLLSGYPNKIYEKLTAHGWKYKSIETALSAKKEQGKRERVVEGLWWNYEV